MCSAATPQLAPPTARVWPRKMLSSCCCCNPNSGPWEVSEEWRAARVQRRSPALERLCRNLCRPYGTRIYFPLHPALRLRLRAGLNSFAPTALDFRPSSSTNKYQVWFSPMLKRPFVMTTQNRETGHYYAAPNYLATLDPSNRFG